jgi:hypothetical protein
VSKKLQKSRKVTLRRDRFHGGVEATYATPYESPHGDYIASTTYTVEAAIGTFGAEIVEQVLEYDLAVAAQEVERHLVEYRDEDGTWKPVTSFKQLRDLYGIFGPDLRVDGEEVEGRIGEAHWALAYLVG